MTHVTEQPNFFDAPNLWDGTLKDLNTELERTSGDRSSYNSISDYSNQALSQQVSSSSTRQSNNEVENEQKSDNQPIQVSGRESPRSRKRKEHKLHRQRRNEAAFKLNQALNSILGREDRRSLIETLILSEEHLRIAEK